MVKINSIFNILGRQVRLIKKVKPEDIIMLITILLVVFYFYPKLSQPNLINDTSNSKATLRATEEVNVKTDGLYNVVKVIDGDTIDVEIGGETERLRLIGLDTPETVDPRKPVQCFGKEASSKAKELLDSKKVRLESDPTQGERDKYNRLLRYVFTEDGVNFDKWMVENGYAHEYTYNLPYKYQAEFKQAEKEARENARGFWSPSTCNGSTN